jgi:hypothetical protein
MSLVLMGAWQDTIRRDRGYFDLRSTWLDTRGYLYIAADAHFGFEVMVIAASHGLDDAVGIGAVRRKVVIIESKAWIANRAIVYECHVKAHGVVGAGAVAKCIVVPEWTLADGNPAMLVAKWEGGEAGGWVSFPEPIKPEKFDGKAPEVWP